MQSEVALAWERVVREQGLETAGVGWGVAIETLDRRALFARDTDRPRAAASAIKTFIALDLIATYDLDRVPRGVRSLLQTGGHPAFEGFSRRQLQDAADRLIGCSYRELASVMMGHADVRSGVYNAACNVILVKLGGPDAVTRRLRALDPAFADVDLNRYMLEWHGDGDNRVTPRALVALYRGMAEGGLPGLDRRGVEELRELARERDTLAGSRLYAKSGTLYPAPMVRVHAGYVEHDHGTVVFAIMGEIPSAEVEDPGELFLRLMSAVDELARVCRGETPGKED